MSVYTSVTRSVYDLTHSMLSDPTTGFNEMYKTVAKDWDADLSIEINFDEGSGNYFRGWYALNTLEQTDIQAELLEGAVICTYIKSHSDGTDSSVRDFNSWFSGSVQSCVEVYIIRKSDNAPEEFERTANAVTDTVFNVFKNRFGANLMPDFGMNCIRNQVQLRGEQFAQKLSFSIPFKVWM
jgi:hypothetical protein